MSIVVQNLERGCCKFYFDGKVLAGAIRKMSRNDICFAHHTSVKLT